MATTSVPVGCDPEFVILDPEGLPVPAHSVGVKQKAESGIFSVKYPNRAVAFRDGYNVEINLPDGKYCRASLLNDVGGTVAAIRKFLPKGYTLTTKAAYRIRVEEQMKDAPPDVQEFGCSPSKDAYTGEDKVVVINAGQHEWRYAGGHLHFGNKPHPYGATNYDHMYGADPENVIGDRSKNPSLVKLFDRFIGVPLAVLFNDDAQWERRKFYGQAGEYREQNYSDGSQGVEYRVPPPELFNHTALISLFSGLGRAIITDFKHYVEQYDPALDDAVIKAINTGEGAKELLLAAPEWYTPEAIIALADRPEIRTLSCDEQPDGHKGWNNFAIEWKLPGKFKPTI